MDESKEFIILAHEEYTSILINYLYKSIYQGIKSIWEDAKKYSEPKHVYHNYLERLSRVKKWNQDVIEHECKRIVNNTKCEWMNDLIKKVLVLNTQILATTNTTTNRKIKVKVPSTEKFIHLCYIECAASFYENPLFMEDRSSQISKIEQSKNLQKSFKLIIQCIKNAKSKLLPIEDLVKDLESEPVEEYNNNFLNLHTQFGGDTPIDTTQSIPQIPQPFPYSQYNPPMTIPTPQPIPPPQQYKPQSPPQLLDFSDILNENENTKENVEKSVEKLFDPLPSLDPRKEKEEKSDVDDDSIINFEFSPSVKTNEKTNLDLDVDSINGNKSIKSINPTSDKNYQKLPAIDEFDSKSFFSDAEE